MDAALGEADASIDPVGHHIVRSADRCSGRPRIRGTRITVDDIVTEWDYLTRADVYAALAYYWDHKDEIDAEEAQDAAFAEQFKRDHPDRVTDLRGE